MACIEGIPVIAEPRTPADCDPNAVTFEPLEVTAPLIFALVVTVAAFPEMLMPCVFVHVLTSARSVVEATTMFAEPLKETPLMVRVF